MFRRPGLLTEIRGFVLSINNPTWSGKRVGFVLKAWLPWLAGIASDWILDFRFGGSRIGFYISLLEVDDQNMLTKLPCYCSAELMLGAFYTFG